MKLNKAGKSAVAVVLAVALALSGTFAWQSISQRAQNEMRRQVNPGGRLHDDYSGWEPGDTKDVYVENFGERPIFARVRLDEYMELGEDAGSKPAAGKVAQPLVTGAKIDDVTTWTTHLPASDFPQNPRDPATDPFHAYWDWTLGGQAEDNPDGVTVYMPTFNMNSDSLSADVNGSLKGSQWKLDADGNRIPFSDYVKYEEGDVADRVRDWTLADETGEGDSNTDPALFKVPNGAFIDADDDTVDEANVTITPPSYNDTAADFRYDIYGNGGTAGTNYKVQEEEHTAKETETARVITMEQYKLLTDQQKRELRAWVYDADGWAYWSQPIEPGTATGLLLDRISLRETPDESWYYAINAVGQFITAEDLGRKDVPGSGFYADANEEPSEDAEDLLNFIGVDTAGVDGTITATVEDVDTGTPVQYVLPNKGYDLLATVTVAGEPDPVQDVTWTVSGNTSADTRLMDEGTTLFVGADEPDGSLLTVTAKSSEYADLRGCMTVPVGVGGLIKVTDAGSTDKINFAGYDWYVVSKNDNVRGHNAALLLMAEKGPEVHFNERSNADSDNYRSRWANSMGRVYLNGENANQFLSGTNGQLIKSKAIEVSTNTRKRYDMTEYLVTTDKVFVLSEADVNGTRDFGKATADAKDYTEGLTSKVTINGGDWIMRDSSGNGVEWPTRTPITSDTTSTINANGTLHYGYVYSSWVRPAFWYDLDG